MIKRTSLVIGLVVSALCVAAITAAFSFYRGAGTSTTTTGCLGGACATSLSSITTTTTTTATSTTTLTGYITVPTTITVTTTTLSATTVTKSCCNLLPRRLGFWVDERDMWSGEGLDWTPQQFVSNYFLTPPYPSALLFATAMTPSGPDSPGALGEASWLSQVASIAQSDGLNVKIMILFFVNLSGGTINGVPDQTALLTQYLSALGNHSNIVNMQYEIEYYGDALSEITTFNNAVTNAGYTPVLDAGDANTGSFPSEQILDYSTYPYFNGTIPSSLPSGSRSIGVGYGETGAPSGNTPNPAWTQQSVQAIIDSSPGNPYVIIYADNGGTGQPAWQLWNWPTLQQWIWTDPNYQAGFITA